MTLAAWTHSSQDQTRAIVSNKEIARADRWEWQRRCRTILAAKTNFVKISSSALVDTDTDVQYSKVEVYGSYKLFPSLYHTHRKYLYDISMNLS